MCVHSQHKNTRHHQSRRQCKVQCQYQWLLLCLYLHQCRSALNKYCTAPVLYRYRGPCTVNLEHLGLSAKIPPCYGFAKKLMTLSFIYAGTQYNILRGRYYMRVETAV